MSHNVPGKLRYTDDHEWARFEGDDVVVIGITDYAQDQLGDITYLELPEVESEFAQGDTMGVVESVKTFSDIYALISGVVVEVNDGPVDDPALLNSAPYSEGWLLKLRVESLDEFEDLMDADTYKAHIEDLA